MTNLRITDASVDTNDVNDRQVQRAADLPDSAKPIAVLASRAMGNWERVVPRMREALTDDATVLLWVGGDSEAVLQRGIWRSRFENDENHAIPGLDRAKIAVLSPK